MAGQAVIAGPSVAARLDAVASSGITIAKRVTVAPSGMLWSPKLIAATLSTSFV
jgi:hypothetical protein